jgi:hypothetical protein
LPPRSNAISTSVTWSRPWASFRKLSRRSAVHFTGRASALEAQAATTSSLYTKIFEPNPPPTSGAITRIFVSGMPRMKAAMRSRWTWGFCEVTQSVRSPVPGAYDATHARGSIAFGIRRWLRRG